MSMEAPAASPSAGSVLGGPWFLSPAFERLLAERGLDPESEAQVRFFAENGYLILDDLGSGTSTPSRIA